MEHGQMLEFARPDGQRTRAYVAVPDKADAATPTVIVIQEWWGLNSHICGIADRFALAGYRALAPDLYHGRLASNADEASHMMNELDFTAAVHQDLAAAVTRLQASCKGPIGITGFCMGGALAIAAAVRLPGLAAASCFYGVPPREFADPARIAIPFQGHFAALDDWCTPAVVDALQASLPAGSAAEIHRYPAHHAFFNEQRPEVFDAACAALAWERTLAFFGKHLR